MNQDGVQTIDQAFEQWADRCVEQYKEIYQAVYKRQPVEWLYNTKGPYELEKEINAILGIYAMTYNRPYVFKKTALGE